MPVVDSHQHFWDLSRFDYPWMPKDSPVLRRNYLPPDLEPLLRDAGVDATVVVQAHPSVEEAEWLLSLARETPWIAGVVAWVDLTDPDVGRTLERLAQSPYLKGVRAMVEDKPDDLWLLRPEVVRGLKEVARLGLAYDLLIRPRHIKLVPELAEEVPDLRMVVDHIAKPPIRWGAFEQWAVDISHLSEIPQVFCKVSGMVTEADHRHWSVEDLRPYVEHVVSVFGLDRLMWGSDWPVCRLSAGYGRVLQSALDALGPLTPAQRERFLGGTAVEFYRLEL